MTNATSKANETPKTPAVETPKVETPKAESTPVVETPKAVESPKVEVNAESTPTLTREFFALLGQTVKNAEDRVKKTKIGGVNGYSSVNQSDATAIVRGDNSIVVRKFQARKSDVKDSDGNITEKSEYNESGELTEDGLDRQATIKQYMEWYYNPPINDSEYEDSEEKTLVENGAILNAVNLVYKATLTGGTADSLAGVFILQSIAGWEESYFLMFDYALRSVVIDGVSLAGANLIDLISYADCRYDIIDSTFGFSVDTEVSAKSDGTPRKRNRASVAGMINTDKTPSPKSTSTNQGLGSNAPTGKVYDPSAPLAEARKIAEASNSVEGVKATPPVVSQTVEKQDDKAQLEAIASAKAENEKKPEPATPVAEDKKPDPVVEPAKDKEPETAKETEPAK